MCVFNTKARVDWMFVLVLFKCAFQSNENFVIRYNVCRNVQVHPSDRKHSLVVIKVNRIVLKLLFYLSNNY